MNDLGWIKVTFIEIQRKVKMSFCVEDKDYSQYRFLINLQEMKLQCNFGGI